MIHNAAPPPARCPVPGRVEERASRPKQVRHNHRMSSRTHVSNAIPAQAEEVVNEACPEAGEVVDPRSWWIGFDARASSASCAAAAGRPSLPRAPRGSIERCPRRGCAHASLSRLSQTRALAGCLVPRPHPRLPSEFASVACFQVRHFVELMSRRPVSHWSVTAYPLIAHLSSRALQLRSCKRHRAAARAGATSAHARCRSVLFS